MMTVGIHRISYTEWKQYKGQVMMSNWTFAPYMQALLSVYIRNEANTQVLILDINFCLCFLCVVKQAQYDFDHKTSSMIKNK